MTDKVICDFGRHRGERYTQIPVSYLKWMVNSKHSRATIAAQELARRGTTTPDMDISGHAIDRASLRCLDIWQATKKEEEGLHAWLCRMAKEALDRRDMDNKGRHEHCGMLFSFERDGEWPVLKTVFPKRNQR